MSHWGHRGWDWFPSYIITMLSQGCRWEKCTQRFVREDAVPWHPFTGYHNRSRMVGKDTLYCDGVPSLPLFSPPPPPPRGGRWGGLAAPNSMFPLQMVRERSVRKVDSALRVMYPLSESLLIRESPLHHFPSVGLRWPCVRGLTWTTFHARHISLVGS